MGLRAAGFGLVLASAACVRSAPNPQPASPSTVRVRVLAFNDFHGALDLNHSPALGPGAAALSAAIAAQRTPNTVVVSAGDLIGGTPLVSGLFHDEPTIEAMNAIGIDFNGVGNHEFDKGLGELLRMQHGGCHPTDGCSTDAGFPGAKFEILAANVTEQPTGALVLPPYRVRDVRGARLAFVGMTLENTPAVTLASAIPELAFGKEVETMKALVPKLRAEGAQVVVLLLHEGGRQTGTFDQCVDLAGPIVEIAKGMPAEVAVIASAHTHQTYNCRLGDRLVTSAGAKGNFLTVIDLEVEVATQRLLSSAAQNVAVAADAGSDPAVQAVVTRYDQLAAPKANRVVGSISATIPSVANAAGESPMADVIADAMREATSGRGAQAALFNTGGTRAPLEFPRSGREDADGQVRYLEAYGVQPFSNEVSVVTVTGADLVAALDHWVDSGKLQVSGLSYLWHPDAAAGARVAAADVTLGGKPVLPAQRYRVAVNTIVASPVSTPSMARATGSVSVGIDLDLLLAYLAAHPKLAPPALNRIARQ